MKAEADSQRTACFGDRIKEEYDEIRNGHFREDSREKWEFEASTYPLPYLERLGSIAQGDVVSSIVFYRVVANKLEFLVRWKFG